MIDAQKLRKDAGVGVALLGGEHRISEAAMPSGKKLMEQSLVVSVRGSVETETARRKRRDRPFALDFHQRFGQ